MYPTSEEFKELHSVLRKIPQSDFWGMLTAIDDFIYDHYSFRILFPLEESTQVWPASSPPPAPLFNHRWRIISPKGTVYNFTGMDLKYPGIPKLGSVMSLQASYQVSPESLVRFIRATTILEQCLHFAKRICEIEEYEHEVPDY
jgi:hypothetical protein